MEINQYHFYLSGTVIPLRLSCSDHTGWPLVISLWYVYRDGLLYCATQRSARIVEYLQKEPRCGYEVASDLPPYCGIRGRATAEIVPELGEEILTELLTRYLGDTSNPLAIKLLAKSETEVAIRLSPGRVHAWNFAERMTDSLAHIVDKTCPEVV